MDRGSDFAAAGLKKIAPSPITARQEEREI